MTADPGGFAYVTGHGGVITPNDSLDVIKQVASAYDIRWLILERGQTFPALVAVLDGTGRPEWIGPPVYAVLPGESAGGERPSAGDADAVPLLAIFPICLSATDTRCAIGGAP